MATDATKVALECGRAFDIRLLASESCKRATVIIVSGMGVLPQVYEPLTRTLAANGFRAATFDYVGIAPKSEDRLPANEVCLDTWAQQVGAVIQWMRCTFPREPVLCIGHSIGCSMICLSGHLGSLQKVVFIAGQNGYWAYWPSILTQSKVWFHWYITFPVLIRMFGRLPGFFW